MKRFAVTHIDSDGLRTLSRANQGRCMFSTRELAEQWLREVIEHTALSTLQSIFGDVSLMAIREVDCYANGDARSIYFDE